MLGEGAWVGGSRQLLGAAPRPMGALQIPPPDPAGSRGKECLPPSLHPWVGTQMSPQDTGTG